ncbi:MAG: c-type cytochrome [Acidimicrobiia bacterium]
MAGALAAIFLASCGTGTGLSAKATEGQRLAQDLGCTSCHSDQNGVGPSWEDAWGTTRPLADGSNEVFDADYVRSSLSDPSAQVVDGYQAIMPAFSLSETQVEAIIAFLEEAK